MLSTLLSLILSLKSFEMVPLINIFSVAEVESSIPVLTGK